MLEIEDAAVKFKGGRRKNGIEWLQISDSGCGLGVPLGQTESLFEPFERNMEIRDDLQSIAMGGQGLGLAIVRMIARRRQAVVAFVEPERGYSTTFEISWRGARR